MNHLFKLAIPVGLGLAAGVLNFFALRQETFDYVTVKAALPKGSRFPTVESGFSRQYVGTKISGAIPWGDRAVLYDGIVPRNLQANDFLFLGDIETAAPFLDLKRGDVAVNISLEEVRFEPHLLNIGQYVGFAIRHNGSTAPASGEDASDRLQRADVRYEILGRFKIVSLGDRIRETSRYGDDRTANARSVTTISVACTPDATNPKLLSSDSSRLIEANRNHMIAAVVLYPDARAQDSPHANHNKPQAE